MSEHIPSWVARPAAVLTILAALAGSAMVCVAAATGDYWWAVWGGICFAGSAFLWYLGDWAATFNTRGPA